MKKNFTSSFTKAYNCIQNEVRSECGVGPAVDLNEKSSMPVRDDFQALWDTGATCTGISSKLVKELSLESNVWSPIQGVHGSEDVRGYTVSIYLPTGIYYPALEVVEITCNSNFDILIGMDIISTGDFAITNKGGKTKFSFRCPSIHDIDFDTLKS